MARLIYILVFGLIANMYSQESTSFQCHGKVTNELNTVDGIYVVNLKCVWIGYPPNLGTATFLGYK